uniref:ABC transporter permease n=1 Tax=Ralstonia sp. RL TaxID=1839756 RepID=UPI000ABD5A16
MNWSRFLAILIKEFRQLRRDRLTFAMMVGVPVMQLILFGYAINTDPKHLPLAVVSADHSEFSRSLVASLENSAYFRVAARPASEAEGNRLLDAGRVQFLLVIPPDFSRRILRGEQPAVLLAADATDPAASGNALATLNAISRQVLAHNPIGQRAASPSNTPFEIRAQRRYNPEGVSRYNIV